MLRHLDLFAGIGGFSLAANWTGIVETNQFVEIEPYCQLVLSKNFPSVPIHSDVTTFSAPKHSYDIVTFGSPCFEGDTLILTNKGFVEIKDIKIGDLVLTHKRRWRKVIQKHKTIKPIRTIKARGMPCHTTDEHPFFTTLSSEENPDFLEAEKLIPNKHYLLIPKIPTKSSTKNKYNRLFKSDLFNFGKQLSHRDQGDENKEIPIDILRLSISKQNSFLDGYLSASNLLGKDNFQVFSYSSKLILGLSFLIQSVYGIVPNIETLSKQDKIYWGLRVDKNKSHRIDFIHQNFGYAKIRKNVSSARIATVYNIGVEEDESYTANGFSVHNCQDVSSAGKREGIKGDRSGLFFEGVRIIEQVQPLGFIFENVLGIRKWQKQVLQELHDIGGYNVYWFSISVEKLGGCHKRERWFAVGWKSDVSDSEQNARLLEAKKNGIFSFQQPTFIRQNQWRGQESATELGGCYLLSRVDASHSEPQRCRHEGDKYQYPNSEGEWQNLSEIANDRDRIRDFSSPTHSVGGRTEADVTDPCSLGYEKIAYRGIGEVDSNGREILSSRSSEFENASDSHPSGAIGDATFQLQRRATEEVSSRCQSAEEKTISRICIADDGVSQRLAYSQLMSPQEAYRHIEKGTASDSRKLKYRNKAIQALGNAVTPQQAYVCFRILLNLL